MWLIDESNSWFKYHERVALITSSEATKTCSNRIQIAKPCCDESKVGMARHATPFVSVGEPHCIKERRSVAAMVNDAVSAMIKWRPRTIVPSSHLKLLIFATIVSSHEFSPGWGFRVSQVLTTMHGSTFLVLFLSFWAGRQSGHWSSLSTGSSLIPILLISPLPRAFLISFFITLKFHALKLQLYWMR